MITKKLFVENLDGEKTEIRVYLNLTRMEAVKLNKKYGGDIEKYVTNLQNEKDDMKVIEFIEDLILTAYGKRSEDGLRLLKSPEIRAEFENSLVYAELFEQILTMNEQELNHFFLSILPKQANNAAHTA